MKLAKNARAVAVCAISPDASMIAVADKHNDHNLSVFNTDSGDLEFFDKGGPDEIFDITFSKDGQNNVWTAGKKHLKFWNKGALSYKKGIFGKQPRTSFACITSDDKGSAFAGAANSLIYQWQGNSIKKTFCPHDKGFVGAIMWNNGLLYSGGKDGKVFITDTESGDTIKGFDFGVLPRAIDYHDGNFVVGLRSGSIIECNVDSGEMTTLQ